MLTGSPSAVITLGLGSWGSPSLLLTLGYGAGAATNQLTDRWANVMHLQLDPTRHALAVSADRSKIQVDAGRIE